LFDCNNNVKMVNSKIRAC